MYHREKYLLSAVSVSETNTLGVIIIIVIFTCCQQEEGDTQEKPSSWFHIRLKKASYCIRSTVNIQTGNKDCNTSMKLEMKLLLL